MSATNEGLVWLQFSDGIAAATPDFCYGVEYVEDCWEASICKDKLTWVIAQRGSSKECQDVCDSLHDAIQSAISKHRLDAERLAKALEACDENEDYMKEIQEMDANAQKYETQGDMYGWNFYKGRRSGIVQWQISKSKIIGEALAAHREAIK